MPQGDKTLQERWRTVRAELVHHRLVGVRDGDLAERVVARKVCGVEKHLEVHHVVNDHQKIARIPFIPAARTANDGIKARRQRCSELLDSVPCGFIIRIAG